MAKTGFSLSGSKVRRFREKANSGGAQSEIWNKNKCNILQDSSIKNLVSSLRLLVRGQPHDALDCSQLSLLLGSKSNDDDNSLSLCVNNKCF